ncbi:putative reverse transcriptase domain-containing protein [Tanacetum coccineum]|uniref:Reverse transcriptase domain-containing protein n=1 Tax=Tanacetum coccineum TaxID=301880 RepID=A0ABQ5D983_9ASTR
MLGVPFTKSAMELDAIRVLGRRYKRIREAVLVGVGVVLMPPFALLRDIPISGFANCDIRVEERLNIRISRGKKKSGENKLTTTEQRNGMVASTLGNFRVMWRERRDTNATALLVEELCPSNEMEKLELELWNHKMVGGNHAAYTDRFHELARLVPHMVTPESSRIKRYVAGLAPEIRGMVKATQPTTIQNAVLRAGILTDEAISCGTLSKECVSTVRDLDILPKIVGNLNVQFRWWGGRAPGQAGNQLAIEGNRGSRNNGNTVRGRAYNVNVNVNEASRDPNVVTGTFSLNNHFASVLFDSGADFSFISTENIIYAKCET